MENNYNGVERRIHERREPVHGDWLSRISPADWIKFLLFFTTLIGGGYVLREQVTVMKDNVTALTSEVKELRKELIEIQVEQTKTSTLLIRVVKEMDKRP